MNSLKTAFNFYEENKSLMIICQSMSSSKSSHHDYEVKNELLGKDNEIILPDEIYVKEETILDMNEEVKIEDNSETFLMIQREDKRLGLLQQIIIESFSILLCINIVLILQQTL